jgi:hypothetical protein
MLLEFQTVLSSLYKHWKDYLRSRLSGTEMDRYQAIIDMKASPRECKRALHELSQLLAKQSGRGVVVLVDEYDVPIACASEHGYFAEVCPGNNFKHSCSLMKDIQANEYFGCGVFSLLLKVYNYATFHDITEVFSILN